MRQDAVVILHRLTKAKTRVKNDVRNALFRQLGQTFFKERLRIGSWAHQHIGHACQSSLATRHIVYNKGRPETTHTLRCYGRPKRIDRQRNLGKRSVDSLQSGQQTLQLLFFPYGRRLRTRGTSTHIHNGSSICNHLTGTLHDLVHGGDAGSCIERIGRHIQDAHNDRNGAV